MSQSGIAICGTPLAFRLLNSTAVTCEVPGSLAVLEARMHQFVAGFTVDKPDKPDERRFRVTLAPLGITSYSQWRFDGLLRQVGRGVTMTGSFTLPRLFRAFIRFWFVAAALMTLGSLVAAVVSPTPGAWLIPLAGIVVFAGGFIVPLFGRLVCSGEFRRVATEINAALGNR
jgi:hypothetical protein